MYRTPSKGRFPFMADIEAGKHILSPTIAMAAARMCLGTRAEYKRSMSEVSAKYLCCTCAEYVR
jgi:hypothetical protein